MQKLAKKFVKVMKECAYVTKNGSNDFHKYKYATSADVMGKVNAALTRHGIASVITPALLSVQEVTTSKGNTELLVTVEVTITLIDSESGESFAIKGLGSGQDAGDKALAKAQTMALKYCYMASLAITTGDDPEADSHTDDAMNSKPPVDMSLPPVDMSLPAQNKSATSRTRTTTKLVCHDCGANISQKVADFHKQNSANFFATTANIPSRMSPKI